MKILDVPFNRPFVTGAELGYITQAQAAGRLSGDGRFTKYCSSWIEKRTGCAKALLTHSCTAALELAAILSGVGPGDEVIMPSYTFVSTANAFVLRGARPVFVDIRSDTLNLDECLIEAAITDSTKAIVPVHYAGIACEMDSILAIAQRYGLVVIEDAAQAVMASYRGRPLGSIGQFGCFSFHETKNITCGEGGALLINDSRFAGRAEIIREKGTNRGQFFRGEVDKYTWTDIGSSFLPGELMAAFLWAQMQEAEYITNRRLGLWNRYHAAFSPLEDAGIVRRPSIPKECQHNAHMYYLLMPDLVTRSLFIEEMKTRHIGTVFHYVPLHSAPAGRIYGTFCGNMTQTDFVSDRLVRMPLWVGLEDQFDELISTVCEVLARL